MDPKDFMDVAKTFHVSAIEAERRTSVGRSYYALYNRVQQTIHSINPSLFNNKGKDHFRAAEYLRNSGDSKLQAIGQDLSDLHDRRKDADYRMALSIKDTDSEAAFKIANSAFSDFDAFDKTKLNTLVAGLTFIK